MSALSYPLRHISVRVPWHDNAWNGSVCKAPTRNIACLKLKGIAKDKREETEERFAGRSIDELEPREFPACVKERATFMAPFAFERMHEHPYIATSSETHGHFLPTHVPYPAYAAAALPFRWMMRGELFGDPKKRIKGLIDQFPLEGVSLDYEPELPFTTNWIQDHRNHRLSLECFWNHVQPETSLVFFYAKQVPLVDDTGRRVLIGVGRVKRIGEIREYSYEKGSEGKLRSLLWERMVTHSIRPNFEDGFLLPYHEVLAKSDDGRAFDPAEAVAFAPDDRFTEFSYGTEHVSSDAAISSLLSIQSALNRCSELIGYAKSPLESWIDRELGRLWKKRGAFPGIGAVLSATGVPLGNFVAQALVSKCADSDSPWAVWHQALKEPSSVLPLPLAKIIDKTIAKAWMRMEPARRQYLELLSRLDLSQAQAEMLVDSEARSEWGCTLGDDAILANPYLFYETTRLTADPISVGIVDRGLFPEANVTKLFPVPEPSTVSTAVDSRRLRALIIRSLETAAQNGDTLRPRADMLRDIRQHVADGDEIRTQLTVDILKVVEDELFEGEIRVAQMHDGSAAYQLERLAATGEQIRNLVVKRIQATRFVGSVDWNSALNAMLPALPGDVAEREIEMAARLEKTAALVELAASPFSVLIGRAGTGKTTLLSVLCSQAEINRGGIVLLAPTGKARVRMEDVAKKAGITNYHAYTLAQFLSDSDRYLWETQRYVLTGEKGKPVAKTVIVDECSMLTEEMLAALIESLSKVDRLILVGDYRQLPPIGAGRPFVDIVAHLRPENFPPDKPRVARGYAELLIPRRQGAGQRDDLLLASWFGGGETSAGDDQVFEILSGQRKSETIRFVTWETAEELESRLPEVLRDTLRFKPEQEDWKAFSLSLGGTEDDNGSVWFNNKWGPHEGSGIAAESWQILSPVRQKPWGVDALNRFIHLRYKDRQIEQARNPGRFRSIPSPKGEHQIIYGDKVINNRNWSVSIARVFPTPEKKGYLANGEIGMVVGHRKTKKRNWTPRDLEIEFSTQRGITFKFYPSDFKDEGEAKLELAYALTIHKAQGSEFKTVILVLPRSPLMVTRELLYTALTRQKERVVVLLQGAATELHAFSSEKFSATACRLTNLFCAPKPVHVQGKFLEDRLIHNTERGELVRSKSEVIIANMLNARKIDYAYEQELLIDGVPMNKYPDFTIEDDDLRKTYLWEHLGMLGNAEYRRRWEEKLRWYREHGILPSEEGGGPNGTLVITKDDAQGGIDSAAISEVLKTLF